MASHLTSHSGISHLTFIGSRTVAHRVAESAARSLTALCLELGGKDAAIVLDDVRSLDKVASILLRGVFQSAGQNCVGIERVVACRRNYVPLIEILEPRIRALRVGSALDDEEGVDVGAMISDKSFDRIEQLINEAVEAGARCLVGGKRYAHPKHPRGHYFSPTLLVDVTADMAIAREETFAPVCLIMKATDVDEAIAIANATEYGLGASVFGSNPSELDKVVRGVKAGMVSVNDFAVYYAVQLPFGGTKGSGTCSLSLPSSLKVTCPVRRLYLLTLLRNRLRTLRRRGGAAVSLQHEGRLQGSISKSTQHGDSAGFGLSHCERCKRVGDVQGHCGARIRRVRGSERRGTAANREERLAQRNLQL